MLINELTFYELKSILDPVIRLEKMTDVVSKIGGTLLIEKPNRKNISGQANKYHIQYKGFNLFISDLRWIKNQGPSITIQFKRNSSKFESFVYKIFSVNSWLGELPCKEIINDLQKICTSNIRNINFETKELEAYYSSNRKNNKLNFWATYPTIAYNNNWDEGVDISPLLITHEYHSDKWFIIFSFNAGSFKIHDKQTELRDNWQDFIGQVSKSIKSEALRNFKSHDKENKSFEDWSEDMVLEYGDEIIPSLNKVWLDINN